MNKKLTVIVADDHPAEILGIIDLLEFVNTIKVIDTDNTAQGAVRKVLEKKPDVILMDVDWLGNPEEGLTAIRQIREAAPNTRILAMSNYDHLLPLARQAGADRAISKNFLLSKEAYAEHIQAAYDSRLLPAVPGNRTTFEKLSRREKEVLALMCDGLQDKEIAGRLTISIGTEKKYVSDIYQKLEVKGRSEAVSKALRSGLLAEIKKPEE